MAKKNINVVKDLLFYSYSNLAMAHMAVEKRQQKYGTYNFMVRAKLFKGLKDGTMNIRSLFDDEKIKLQTGNICNYCGSEFNLSLDHVFPQKFGGKDNIENLILACKSCNSSKGKKDLMTWMYSKNQYLPLMVIRRYLKLVYHYCDYHKLLDLEIKDLDELELPFDINKLPTSFPKPTELILNIND